MGIFIPGFTLVLAWILAAVNVAAPGAVAEEVFMDSAMRWLLFLPGGFMFLASFVMHSVFAKKTAASIGWQTNGFQYEIAFASLGFGIAGIIAATSSSVAWLPIAVAQSIFLVLAGVNHVREMVQKKNFARQHDHPDLRLRTARLLRHRPHLDRRRIAGPALVTR